MMNNKALKKLSCQSGESIVETLIALLISALALMMLAGAVSAGVRMVTRSKTVIDSYYKANNDLATKSSSRSQVEPLTVTLSKQLVPKLESEESNKYTVSYWKNDVLPTPVIAYEKATS